MAIFPRVMAALVIARRRLRAAAADLNRALTEWRRSEADPLAREREETVFQPLTTTRGRRGR